MPIGLLVSFFRHKPLSFRTRAATSGIARVNQMTTNVWVDWNLMLIVAKSAYEFLYFLGLSPVSNSAVKMLVIYVCFSPRSVQGCWLKLLNMLHFDSFISFRSYFKLYSN